MAPRGELGRAVASGPGSGDQPETADERPVPVDSTTSHADIRGLCRVSGGEPADGSSSGEAAVLWRESGRVRSVECVGRGSLQSLPCELSSVVSGWLAVFSMSSAPTWSLVPQLGGLAPLGLARPQRRLSVVSERRREVPLSVDLRLQIGDLLLRGGNGIGAGDKASRRWLLARNDDERSRELRRVAGLLAGLGFPKLELLRPALVVVLDGRLGIVRRCSRHKSWQHC